MSERRFAVIGHPIGHTMSPFIHDRLFELAGERGRYTAVDISPEELPSCMKELNGLCGYNITIPHKQSIIHLIDRLDKKAGLYGSVNTVRNGSVREGFTTDPDGFLKALEGGGIPLKGRVVVLGSGGAARTFVYEAALAGCDITIAVRKGSSAKGEALAREVREKLGVTGINTCLTDELDSSGYDTDLLVNATPVGMYPKTDFVPVSDRVIERSAGVFDAVYNPLETMLIRKARANGSMAVGGMSMLVWQAAAAHEIWDGSVYDNDSIDQLIEDAAAEMKKIF